MKAILLLSLPATVGILSWMLSWAFVFAFPPNSYHPYAHDMQMTFNRIFALMLRPSSQSSQFTDHPALVRSESGSIC
jgi:hypothetical protein